MKFSDIMGMDEIKSHLINAIHTNQIAHAQLFTGNEGSANLSLALAYTTLLNCQDKKEGGACGQCASCVKNSKFIHPDVHFIFPVSANKKVSGKDVISTHFMNEWRAFLTKYPYGNLSDWSDYFGGENKQAIISREASRYILRNVSLKAYEGGYKVIIIWLPEYMHPSAANAILKALEEPPQKTVFLLVSNDREKLLSTILSRTQIVHVRPFFDDEMEAYLEKNHQADKEKAKQVASIAQGNLNKAIKLLDNIKNDHDMLFQNWMRLCYMHDYLNLVNQADTFHKMNKIAQKSLLQYSLETIRKILLYCTGAEALINEGGELLTFIQKFSKTVNALKAEKMTLLLNEALTHLERNASPKMIFLDVSLQFARIMRS